MLARPASYAQNIRLGRGLCDSSRCAGERGEDHRHHRSNGQKGRGHFASRCDCTNRESAHLVTCTTCRLPLAAPPVARGALWRRSSCCPRDTGRSGPLRQTAGSPTAEAEGPIPHSSFPFGARAVTAPHPKNISCCSAWKRLMSSGVRWTKALRLPFASQADAAFSTQRWTSR